MMIMPAEMHNSSDLSNDTQGALNYLLICIKNPLRANIWMGYSAFCFLLGFPATIIVLKKLCERRRPNVSNEFFMFNLTIIDLVFLCFLPFNVSNYKVWHNDTVDYVCNYVYLLVLAGRPLFMACICGEYYFAVLHPIMYRTNKRTAIMRKAIAMVVWFVASCLAYLIALNPWFYTIACVSLILFIALPVIGFCDISVFWALRKKDPSGKTTVHPQKKRALQTIISSFVVTFTAYLPPAVIFVMGYDTRLSSSEVYFCVFTFIAVCFSISGCVIMPLLYLESIDQLNMRKIAETIQSFISSCPPTRCVMG